jgi:hypothetical protein
MSCRLQHATIAGLLWLCTGCDPVQDNAVAALGGDPSGARPGPTHRPGQPCLLCHDGALGDPQEFSIAGTVYQNAADKQPARNAVIELKSADGSRVTFTTNAAGNFYAAAQRYSPKYPLEVSVSYQSQTVSMTSVVGRDGSCAGCHVDPAGPASPGHVYAIANDAGAP